MYISEISWGEAFTHPCMRTSENMSALKKAILPGQSEIQTLLTSYCIFVHKAIVTKQIRVGFYDEYELIFK